MSDQRTHGRGRAIWIAVVAMLGALALPPGAGPYVYWGNDDVNKIGRGALARRGQRHP